MRPDSCSNSNPHPFNCYPIARQHLRDEFHHCLHPEDYLVEMQREIDDLREEMTQKERMVLEEEKKNLYSRIREIEHELDLLRS